MYPATHIGLAQILCTTPPVAALTPAVSRVGLQTDFSVPPPEVLVGGNAVVEGGVLKLTNAVPRILQEATGNASHFKYGRGELGAKADYQFGPKPTGWAVVELPAPMPALWDWRVSFELFIGGGSGGDGIAFLYGDMGSLTSIEQVGGLSAFGHSTIPQVFVGLEVSFLTRPAHHIRVSYNGTLLHVFDVHKALRTQSWVQVLGQRSPNGPRPNSSTLL